MSLARRQTNSNPVSKPARVLAQSFFWPSGNRWLFVLGIAHHEKCGLLQPPFTLGPTPPTESVTNGDSKWHRSIDRKAGCIYDAQGSLFSVVIGSFAGSVAHLYSWIAWLFRLANC